MGKYIADLIDITFPTGFQKRLSQFPLSPKRGVVSLLAGHTALFLNYTIYIALSMAHSL